MAGATALRKAHDVEPQVHELELRWPWWLHPAWALLALTGTMAVVSVMLPDAAYMEWRLPKYLQGGLQVVLFVLLFAMVAGISLGSRAKPRGAGITLRITARQTEYLRRTYRALFTLTLIGYAIWLSSAAASGVGVGDLAAVLSREGGAISDLKANSRPIAGVTTMTQFGPLVVAIGAILARLGLCRRWYRWMLVLAAVRTLFYAERLALIEVVVPLLMIAALTTVGHTKKAAFVRSAPLIVTPLLWLLFAASEYTRSWVYYQTRTSLPFPEWVSLRLLGYYTTSFDNSALMTKVLPAGPPYFSFDGFWKAPILSSIIHHPGFFNMDPVTWWSTALAYYGNPEFNNTGSFLVTYRDLGLPLAITMWLLLGVVAGVIFRRAISGSVPALLAAVTLFVGVLELSRFIYWTQGRAVPLILALAWVALTWPRDSSADDGVVVLEGGRGDRDAGAGDGEPRRRAGAHVGLAGRRL